MGRSRPGTREDQSNPALSADWLAYVGSEDYGVWLLRPDDANADESRAAFSLIAAHIIAKLAILPIPVPQPLEYCPHWKMSCNAEEESVRKEGKELDLSDAVPHGLDKVDLDAVDPCTRALLELLRRESRGFRITSNGTDWIKGTAYPAVTGTIEDLCGTTVAYIKRRAREEIGAHLSRSVSLSNSEERKAAKVFPAGGAQLLAERRKTKKPVRRNHKYVAIDNALRGIAESLPQTHEEVFQSLQSRNVVIPPAEPFLSARGWIPGFRRGPAAARAWLSKRWTLLKLPPFLRGPK